MHHIEVKENFLRDLKEEGIIHTKWIPGETNPADLFMKNLPGLEFEKHIQIFCGKDQYNGNSKGEGIRSGD